MDESWYEALRDQYRPKRLTFLLVGESPPDSRDAERPFFYSPTLTRHDNLYRGVAEAVLGNELDFDIRDKPRNLKRLTKSGYFLLDAVAQPVNHLSRSQRRRAISGVLPDLYQRIEKPRPAAGIIICHTLVYEALAPWLGGCGSLLLHDSPLPFPLGNHRAAFIEGFRRAVNIGERLMAWREKNRHENELPPCPFCESDRVIPVLYGLPTREAFELADGGELVLGGCTVTGLNAHWACSTCGRQW